MASIQSCQASEDGWATNVVKCPFDIKRHDNVFTIPGYGINDFLFGLEEDVLGGEMGMKPEHGMWKQIAIFKVGLVAGGDHSFEKLAQTRCKRDWTPVLNLQLLLWL